MKIFSILFLAFSFFSCSNVFVSEAVVENDEIQPAVVSITGSIHQIKIRFSEPMGSSVMDLRGYELLNASGTSSWVQLAYLGNIIAHLSEDKKELTINLPDNINVDDKTFVGIGLVRTDGPNDIVFAPRDITGNILSDIGFVYNISL